MLSTLSCILKLKTIRVFQTMHVCISTDMMVISYGDGVHCLMAACMVLYLAVMGF